MRQTKRTREQMKAELMAQAEQAIEQLLGWSADTPQGYAAWLRLRRW